MQQASVDELLAPSHFLLAVDAVKQLLKGLSLLFGINVSYNFDDARVPFGNFNCLWCCVIKLHSKNLVTIIIFVLIFSLKNLDLYVSRINIVIKMQCALRGDIVSSRLCYLADLICQLYSSILAANLTVATFCAVNCDTANFLSGDVFL